MLIGHTPAAFFTLLPMPPRFATLCFSAIFHATSAGFRHIQDIFRLFSLIGDAYISSRH